MHGGNKTNLYLAAFVRAGAGNIACIQYSATALANRGIFIAGFAAMILPPLLKAIKQPQEN